jgi:hypothetical protein
MTTFLVSKLARNAAAEDAEFAKLFGPGELLEAQTLPILSAQERDRLGALPPAASMPAAMPSGTFARFMLAGNATFTIQSRKTGTRFTFKVVKKDPTPQYPNPIHFVKVLTGAENETAYTYLGQITARGYQHGRKSPIQPAAPSAMAFAWFVGHVLQGQPVPGVDVYHAGKCGRCGRKLTVPESITSGFGPECIGLVGGGA